MSMVFIRIGPDRPAGAAVAFGVHRLIHHSRNQLTVALVFLTLSFEMITFQPLRIPAIHDPEMS